METGTDTAAAKEPKSRHRSPNYPSIGLKVAIDKIQKWYKQDGLVSSPRDAALAHMGLEKFTGEAGRLLSALKSFGLVQETDGRLKLTPRAVDIVVRPEGDQKRAIAIRQAATGPQIYKDLLKEYKLPLPSDGTLRAELVASKGFNPKVVDDFISDFRETVKFAGLSAINELDLSNGYEESTWVRPKIGDYVQWESQGVLQFTEPKRVRALSEDGSYAFFEGSDSGVPVKDLIIEERVQDTPPALGRESGTGGRHSQDKPSVRQDIFSLVEGPVTIQWPASLSAESFEDLGDWLDILKRKIGRSVKSAEAGEQDFK